MATYATDSEGKFIPASQRPDGTWRKARRVRDGYVPQEEVPLYESKGKQFAQRKTGLPPGMCPYVVEQAKKEREKQERAKAKKLEKEAGVSVSGGTNATGISTSAKTKKTKTQQNTPGVLLLNSGNTSSNTNNTSSSSTITTTTTTKTIKPANSKKPNAINNKSSSAAAGCNVTNMHIDELATQMHSALTMATMANANDNSHQNLTKQLKKLRKKLREIEALEVKITNGELKKPDKDQQDKVKRKKDVIKEIKKLELELPDQAERED